MPLRFSALTVRCSLLISLLSVCAIAQPAPQFPFEGCDKQELQYYFSPQDPAYDDAMQLARMLSGRGIKINCVGQSKWSGEFVGQKGAAAFRTDQGMLNALFMFEPEQLAYFAVVERRPVGSLHTYEFYGTPTVRTMQGREHFFLKQDATLFVTADEKLAEKLAAILGEQSRLCPSLNYDLWLYRTWWRSGYLR